MYPHKIRQIELAVRPARKERPTLFESGDVLPGKIVVRQQSAAIRVSFQSLIVECSEQGIHVHPRAEGFQAFPEQVHPGIQVRSTVVAVHHGHRVAGRRGHHVDLLIRSGQRLFQNRHCKYTGPCGYISGTDRHAVGGCHSGSRVSLRRAQRNPCLQLSAGIQKARPLLCQCPRMFSCHQHPGKDFPRLPWKCFVTNQLVKLFQHPCVKILCVGINGEHAGRLPDPDHLFPGQLPVDIACQRRQEADVLHVLLPVQDRLIQMGDAPALGDMEAEHLRKLVRSLSGNGISPGPKRRQKPPLPVKRKIAVHHAAESDASHLRQRHAVLAFHILLQLSVAVLQSCPYVLHGIGPDVVLKPVLPVMPSGCDGGIVRIHQNGLDPCGTKFDPQNCLTCADDLCCFHFVHNLISPFLQQKSLLCTPAVSAAENPCCSEYHRMQKGCRRQAF